MRINGSQLLQQKQLKPAYLLSSDELLLRDEALQHLQKLAHTQGFQITKRWQSDSGFNWQEFLIEATQGDLFSEQALLHLHLPSLKIGTEGGNALSRFFAEQTPQQLLIITCDKLDSNALKSKWFTTLEQHACVVQLWPPEKTALPQWIAERLKKHNIEASRTALNLIADSSEGNLLAVSQSIERLFLHYGSKSLSDDEVKAILYDSSRYSVFDLVDAWLAGNKTRMHKIFVSLKQEGLEPILMLWALVRECRLLANIKHDMREKPFASLTAKYAIWQKRIPLIKQHLDKNYDYAIYLQQLANIECVLKGVKKGAVWDELEKFLVGIL